MPNTPHASVIVPTHHGAHRLVRLLDNLSRQDTDQPWEALFVVDGRVDATPELLNQWADRLPIVILVNESATGVASALTRGFDAALGTYLIRCDDDLEVPPTFISDHLRAHDGRTDLVVVARTEDVFPDTPYARAYGIAANRRGLAVGYSCVPEDRWLLVAGCFSLHRHAWRAGGGFDPRFAYGEDSELGYRLARAGCHVIAPPALQIRHRGPASNARTRVPRAFVSGASRRLFADVHPGALPDFPRATSLKGRAWDVAVDATARLVRNPGGYRTLGSLADKVLPFLPRRLGGPLVAWLVESAGRSGARYGSTDLHSYRTQKDAEVMNELRRAGRRSTQ